MLPGCVWMVSSSWVVLLVSSAGLLVVSWLWLCGPVVVGRSMPGLRRQLHHGTPFQGENMLFDR